MNRRTILFRDGLVFIVVVGAIFLGAVLREVNLLLFFASVLSCFLFLDFRLGKKTIKRLAVTRTPPATIHAGDSFLMTVRLENRSAGQTSWGVIVEDRIVPLTGRRAVHVASQDVRKRQMEGYRPVCYFEKVEPGETARESYAGQLPLRGRYQLGPTSVSTRFPLGFFRSTIHFRETSEILVFPKIGTVDRRWLDAYTDATSEEERRRRPQASRTADEFLSVRPWQSGDVRKWIHWRASARHNELLVRQFQDRYHQDIAVVLDAWLPGRVTRAAFENLELAVSFAATVVKEFSGSAAGALYFSPGTKEEVYHGKNGRSIYNTAMEELAVLQPTVEDMLPKVLRNLFDVIGASTNIILVTRAPIDLTNSERIAALAGDPALRRFFDRIHVIDVSWPSFDAIFHV